MKESVNIDELESKILATFYGYEDIKKKKGKLVGKLHNQ